MLEEIWNFGQEILPPEHTQPRNVLRKSCGGEASFRRARLPKPALPSAKKLSAWLEEIDAGGERDLHSRFRTVSGTPPGDGLKAKAESSRGHW